MAYQAVFKQSFFKDLTKIPKKIRVRVDEAVTHIIDNPFLPSALKLAGQSQLYRYRLGDYRLVYYLNQKERKILFLLLAHRKDVYKKIDRLH